MFSDFFSITRGAGPTQRTDTVGFSNLDANRITKYRKYQNTIEGDYQFNPRYSIHLRISLRKSRASKKALKDSISAPTGRYPPPARTSSTIEEQNHTHAFLGGFKARPAQQLDHLLRRRTRHC